MKAFRRWSPWRPFPNPAAGGCLSAPFGPGLYELRNRTTGEHVLFGRSKNVAHRMSSLLPRPIGAAGRSNLRKRQYVLDHLGVIEYRTRPCRSEPDARSEERSMRDGKRYIFPT